MMWLKEAIVVDKLSSGEYKVLFLEHAACKSCGACKGFAQDKEKVATVPSEVDVEKGDRCYVGMEQGKLLKMAFFIYLFPLILFFSLLFLIKSVFMGFSWKTTFFVAFGGLLVSFIVAFKYFDKKFRSGEWGMRIVKKIEGEKNND